MNFVTVYNKSNPVVMTDPTVDSMYQTLEYNATTMQIYHPLTGLCLQDQGMDENGQSNSGIYFQTCDPSSYNQQFIFTADNQIYNPNWPNNQLCLNANGNEVSVHNVQWPTLYLGDCSDTNTDEIFNILLYCPAGV